MSRLPIDDVIFLEDGYMYYDPHGLGAISEHELETVVQYMKLHNEQWSKQIEESLSCQ